MDPRHTVAALIRGERVPIDDACRAEQLVARAIDDRVAAILAREIAGGELPPRAQVRLMDDARDRRVLAALMDEEIAKVLAALDADGIRPLVIKGAHLAHTIYSSPELRPRADTDLLVAENDRERLQDALARIGYERFPHVRGTVILGQFHFTRTDRVGVVHALDVHWRVAAPLVFAKVLPFEMLQSTAVPIPSLGAHAFGPSPAHALVLACIHLAAHHRRNPILLWLYDIWLLAQALDEMQQTAFTDAAAASGVTAICASVLEDTRHYFDDSSIAALIGRVVAGGRARSEPSARLMTAERPIDELLLDLTAPAPLHTRLTLLREHLWPDAAYMRATGAQGWLPLAYARRALSGARKWLQRA